MASKDNTLIYLALAALGYWLYTRNQNAPAPVVAAVAPVTVGASVPVPQPAPRFLGPPLRVPKEGQTIVLPAGQQPPGAPSGFYWAQAVIGAQPLPDAPVTWTLLGYQYALNKGVDKTTA